MRLFSTPPDIDDTKVSILDHLEELRGRLLKSLACIVVLFPLCWYFCADVLQWFLDVVCVDLAKVQTLQVMELFFTQMKLSGFMALVLAYPFLAFQVWRFIAPGLYRHERQYVSRFVLASTALFVVGAEFALFYVFPRVVQFGASMATGKIEMTPQLSSVINLAAMLMLGFGVMFQLPIVVYLLAITDMVSVATMRKARPMVVIIIFTLAAILTPTPDVVTQCALAIPSLLLFEASLIFTDMAIGRRRRREQDEEERERAADASAADAAASPAEPPPSLPPPTAADVPPPTTADVTAPTAADVTAPVSPPLDAVTEAPIPALSGARPGEVPNYGAPAEPSGQMSWERWYGNVTAETSDEPKLTPPPAAISAAATALASPTPHTATADDGPLGSGQV